MEKEQSCQDRWLIEDWLPIGHKGMVGSVEGSFKTILKCWWSICIAAGRPIFGKRVEQCPTLIIDEETPEPDLLMHLERFAMGLGFNSWNDLPIKVLSFAGFRLGRKDEMNRIALPAIRKLEARFVSIDSVLACLPGGRQGMAENDAGTGMKLRDDLDTMLGEMTDGTTLVNAHCKQMMGELSVKSIRAYDMGHLIRGIGAIVGQACDTGFLIKKISEYPEPTRFVILTKARRRAIPMTAHDIYVELVEQEYGKGWARLEQIDPVIIPPSRIAKNLFTLFDESGDGHTAQKIVGRAAIYTKLEVRDALDELESRRVIVSSGAFTWNKNPKLTDEVDESYLAKLVGSGYVPAEAVV